MHVNLDDLRPIITGPFRDRIIEFESSDWCCRQAALYVTYALRHFGYGAVILEGAVVVPARGTYANIQVDHAWVVVPDSSLIVDLTLTQANWMAANVDTYPAVPVEPIWGHDTHGIEREINKIWTGQEIRDLTRMEHWNKPGQLYGTICRDMLTDLKNWVVTPSYVALS